MYIGHNVIWLSVSLVGDGIEDVIRGVPTLGGRDPPRHRDDPLTSGRREVRETTLRVRDRLLLEQSPTLEIGTCAETADLTCPPTCR